MKYVTINFESAQKGKSRRMCYLFGGSAGYSLKFAEGSGPGLCLDVESGQ